MARAQLTKTHLYDEITKFEHSICDELEEHKRNIINEIIQLSIPENIKAYDKAWTDLVEVSTSDEVTRFFKLMEVLDKEMGLVWKAMSSKNLFPTTYSNEIRRVRNQAASLKRDIENSIPQASFGARYFPYTAEAVFLAESNSDNPKVQMLIESLKNTDSLLTERRTAIADLRRIVQSQPNARSAVPRLKACGFTPSEPKADIAPTEMNAKRDRRFTPKEKTVEVLNGLQE